MTGAGRSLVFVLLAAPAFAQDAEQALPAVRGCLEGAVDAAAARACVGAFAQGCMAEAGGESTAGMTACTLAEAGAWDRLLNENFAAIMVELRQRAAVEEQSGAPPPAREEMLRAAQSAWAAFRDADCAQEAAMWGEGSMRQIAGAYCTLERTAQRVLELRAKRAALEGN